MSIYGERIKELREEANISPIKFAFKCDWTKSRLSNYENGQRTPKVDDVLVAAKALKPYFGEDAWVYIITGKKLSDIVKGNQFAPFSMQVAVNEFSDLIKDAVDFGRIKLEPELKASDLIESFSNKCASHFPVVYDLKGGSR